MRQNCDILFISPHFENSSGDLSLLFSFRLCTVRTCQWWSCCWGVCCECCSQVTVAVTSSLLSLSQTVVCCSVPFRSVLTHACMLSVICLKKEQVLPPRPSRPGWTQHRLPVCER